MSLIDAIGWEREYLATGYIVEDPKKDGWLMPRKQFLKLYGPRKLLKAYLKKRRIDPAIRLAKEYNLSTSEITAAEKRRALKKLSPREKKLLGLE